MIAHVLVVEDEFLIRMSLTEMLSDAGFDVSEAVNGDSAIDLLDEARPFDILVTDIQMPGDVDGFGVGRYARDHVPGIGIVYVTGRPDSMYVSDPLGSQEALLRKPYDPEQMLETIRWLLDTRQTGTTAQAPPP